MSALRRKYGELKGFSATGDMANVAATLRLFSPNEDLDAIPAIRPYRQARTRWSRTAISMLRCAGEPMTARALARRVLADRGEPQTLYNLQRVECSLHAVLERLEGRGIVRVSDAPKRWNISA